MLHPFAVLSLFLMVVLVGLSTPLSAERRIQTVNFGVVPQQSAQKLALKWQPVFDALQASSGIQILFKTAPDIPEFERRLAEGEYDLAYMNPYHFTVFNLEPGYQAMVRAADREIKGIIVVARDSSIQQLSDLSGLTLAFPAPAAFAASMLPRAYLANENIMIATKYVQTHDSVYLTVARGLYAAGGGVMRTFASMPDNVKAQLRILWTTPGYTPHAIANHPRLSGQVRFRLTQALLHLDQTPEGRLALQGLKINGFTPAEDADWDDVRALKIGLLGG
ncbi:PhnT family ABC superfamily porter [Oleiphilus messinensis]|uniref:PhnT family ABC superfamily porter n=1 Tax=Oleiphilus messinensis TaxID=141451 RepID=A0A1Y0I720_9GAMM|nr:phosphate/phosphite/phosphonate ABC transporter substrate-binding protein [Oleiphilus messinensis]ARU55234.1 PhnT family ABC superfamily porter [Oleiphilus messinensis]